MAIIRDPQEKRLRALMMLKRRLHDGATLEQLSQEFKLSTKSVKKNLDWARKAGIVADAEDRILQDLVPKAIDAVQKGLEQPDANKAAKIGLQVFGGTINGFKKTSSPTAPTSNGDDLDSHLARLRASDDAGGVLDAIDGEIAGESPLRALPSAEAAAPAEGISAPDFHQPSLFGNESGDSSPVGEGIS